MKVYYNDWRGLRSYFIPEKDILITSSGTTGTFWIMKRALGHIEIEFRTVEERVKDTTPLEITNEALISELSCAFEDFKGESPVLFKSSLNNLLMRLGVEVDTLAAAAKK
jgi:hypothetical protein